MRAPNHLEIKAICKSSINKIVENLTLPSPQKILMDDQGWVNICFFIDDSVVIRFNARDVHLPKFHREKVAFDILKGKLPVPDCLVLDDSRTLAPFDYMVCKKIEGKNIEQNWSHLSDKIKNSLSFQAGQVLSQIHSVELNYFGEISGRGPFPKTKTWTEYLAFILDYHLEEAMGLSLFTNEKRHSFLTSFKNHAEIFDEFENPMLIHGDFHLGNLLYNQEKITGVLDFEWALAGDPLFDMSNQLREMDKTWPGSQESFNRGYGIKMFSDEDLKKMKVYAMIKNIELCVVAKKFFSEQEALEYVKITESNY